MGIRAMAHHQVLDLVVLLVNVPLRVRVLNSLPPRSDTSLTPGFSTSISSG